MAQYGHNLYGTAQYGQTNAVYGLYTSEYIDAMEKLKTDMSATLIADLPLGNYVATDNEFIYTGTWTTSGTQKTSTNGSATWKGSLNSFTLTFSGAGAYTINKIINGTTSTVETGTLNGTSLVKSGLEYALYEITVAADASGLTVKSLSGQVCDINMYIVVSDTMAGLDTGNFVKATVGSKVAATSSDVSDLLYPEAKVINSYSYKVVYNWAGLITSTAQKRYYQFKLEMITSDNDIAPNVKTMILSCGDTNLYDIDGGTWVGTFDFGTTFSSYDDIQWDADIPTNTSMVITSASSLDGTNWSRWSNPYVTDQSQLRLVPGVLQGYIETPVMSPRHLKTWASLASDFYVSNVNSVNVVPIDFDFYYKPATGNPIKIASGITPVDVNGNLETALKYNGSTVPVYARINLRRNATNEMTPTINSFVMTAKCEYLKTMSNINGTISRVYGEKKLTDLNTLNFTDRPEDSFGAISYTIIPHTSKNIVMYWASERNSAFRDHTVQKILSPTVNDDICVISNEKYYFNYGTSIIHYDGPTTTTNVKMTNSFRTSTGLPIVTNIKYQYKVIPKWVQTDSLTDIINPTTKLTYSSEDTQIKWTNYVDGDHTDITGFSEINGSTINGNPSNDTIIMTTSFTGSGDEEDWISETLIYDAVVNANGLKKDFTDDKVILPAIDKYAIADNNPYKFEPVEGTIQRNGVPVPSQNITIKSTIVYANDNQLYKDQAKTIPNIDGIKVGTVTIPVLIEDRVVHGKSGGSDRLRYNYSFTVNGTTYNAIAELRGVFKNTISLTTNPAMADYILNTDYLFYPDSSTIDWSPSGTNAKEPNVGDAYYVHYLCRVPLYASVDISCDYKETKIIKNGVWVSQNKQQASGTCSPGHDYVSQKLETLYPTSNATLWGTIPNGVGNLKYTVIDNNIWVETKVDTDNTGSYVKGALGKRNPSKNWYPKIKTGFYYLGKDEYYNYLNPVTVNIGQDKIEYAKNISFKASPFNDEGGMGAILVENGTTNLLTNSNFKVTSTQLSYICRFKNMTSMAQGPSKSITWATE